MSKDYYSLKDKWAADIEACERGGKVPTAYPQCESCAYFIKGNALHCIKFEQQKKPREVMFARKECPEFRSVRLVQADIPTAKVNRLLGGIFGFCIGDMLGVPVEFTDRQERDSDPVKELRAYGTYHQPFGTWSDDTSLMLCLIDAINSGDILPTLRRNMVSYYREGLFTPGGVVFDIGNATATAIQKIEQGVPSDRCGGRSDWDNGNGALMRILPLAFLAEGMVPEELCSLVERVSELTHAHPRSMLACIFYTVLAAQLYNGMKRWDAYNSAVRFVKEHCSTRYKQEFACYNEVLAGNITVARRDQIRSTGYVVDTLEAALWAFMQASSYEEAVLNAVNLGGDTDTIAAITGGLCGIYYGFSELPNRLVQNIRRKEIIMEMTQLMYQTISISRLGIDHE